MVATSGVPRDGLVSVVLQGAILASVAATDLRTGRKTFLLLDETVRRAHPDKVQEVLDAFALFRDNDPDLVAWETAHGWVAQRERWEAAGRVSH